MKRFIAAALILAPITQGCTTVPASSSVNVEELAIKQMVTAFWDAVANGKRESAWRYVALEYQQHESAFEGGLKALLGERNGTPPVSPPPIGQMLPRHIWVDGENVIIMTQFIWSHPWSVEPGADPVAEAKAIDIFEVRNGLIVGHRSTIGNIPPKSLNSNTEF